jgi:hypothetical protein
VQPVASRYADYHIPAPVASIDVRNVYTILNGIRDGKNPRRTCGDNTDMDLKVRTNVE